MGAAQIIANCARLPEWLANGFSELILPNLVSLLDTHHTHLTISSSPSTVSTSGSGQQSPVLWSTLQALWRCALLDPLSQKKIAELDGLRLLWSLLRSQCQRVTLHAAGALATCLLLVDNLDLAARSLTSGLPLLVELLALPLPSPSSSSTSDSSDLSTAALLKSNICACLCTLTQHSSMVDILIDNQLLTALVGLTQEYTVLLKSVSPLPKNLAVLIAASLTTQERQVCYRELGGVVGLIRFLSSPDPILLRATTLALQQLSCEGMSCIAMLEAGAVPSLVKLLGFADDIILQEAAAYTLQHIRVFSSQYSLARRQADNYDN
eukprot:TRINITY_DN4782_c0_g1_i3.p1 TRINITY_DN4782_c0_g1~~TRINITY_DN4782_c0_g1_i3.p1  ORF type:complete len:331 (+),score=55.38 TRINITY_DN4782_c0_g1_i3:27-995(+)